MKKILTVTLVFFALAMSCNGLRPKEISLILVERNGPLTITKPDIVSQEKQIQNGEELFLRKADSMIRSKPRLIVLPSSYPIHLK